MFFINTSYVTDSRYDMAKFMDFKVDNYDILDSYFIKELKKLPVAGVHVISDLLEEKKPDYIAHRIYNNVHFWWIILMYNDIIDLEELKLGKQLNYINLSDLESLYFELKSKDRGNK